jgi:hypothetical protein
MTNPTTNPTISSKKLQPSAHGGGVRGDSAVASSTLFTGRFGRMFRSLPAGVWRKETLMTLGEAMTADPEVGDDPTMPAAAPESDKHIQDDEENAGIAAGYTYLGQFIDHDITFDPASSLQQQNDPNALVDFRTPRLDLDSLYGRGPDDLPYMYDGNKFRLGRPLFSNDLATICRATSIPTTRRRRGARSSATSATTKTSSSPNCTAPCCASTTSWWT